MYEYIENRDPMRVIGSFVTDKNVDFKNGVKSLLESFKGQYAMDAVDDILKILKVETLKEDYKERLIGDVVNEQFEDPYCALIPQKLEQLFENSSLEVIRESSFGPLAPIVGLTLPILKKNFIEGYSKDIVMTEVPSKPIVKIAVERKFLKDKQGTKYYIPEIFYNDDYKTVLAKTKGKTISTTWYPENIPPHDAVPETVVNLPIQDFDLLTASGGSIETRDSLAYDFCIEGIQITVKDAAGTGTATKTITGLHIEPDMAAKGTMQYRVKTEGLDEAKTVVEDILFGTIDFYNGKVSVGSTAGKITKVRFGGHLSNENNTETVEIDRERETKEWKIPDGSRLNSGLTIEKIKDYKALFDIDVTTEVIADMSTCLTQFEDSEILAYVEDSYTRWKDKTDLPFGYDQGFVKSAEFSCTPSANVMVTPSQWIQTELKYNLNRFIDELKVILKETDLMFVVYGHPNNITLIQDDVKWIIDEDTKIGGVQLDYRFGVMTNNKNRIHVISSMKVDKSKGIKVVAYPLTKDVITFKHYKYSLNIENIYRNPLTPLTPNVMGTSRYLTTELLPVQGKFALTNNTFALK
jgi:hypothetical protein